MNPALANRHRVLNMVQTALLVCGSLALFMATAYVFFGPDGIVYAIIFGGVSLFMASRVSPQLVLRMYRASPVTQREFPAGHALLTELSRRAGLAAMPRLYVLPSNLMNAFAVGRSTDSAICLTDKLIRSLTQRELAGVMAHEVSHIANGDIKVMAIADMVSRFTSFLSTFGIVTLFLNLPSVLSGGGEPVPWAAVMLLLFAPTIGALLQLGLSRTREYDADFGAVMLTGDPDGLASALSKLEAAQKAHWEGMILPGGRIPDPSLLRTHPRTADRITRLMAMKQVARTPPPPAWQQRTSVPQAGRRWGRDPDQALRDHASLFGAMASPRPYGSTDADDLAVTQSLNPPRGRPRVHVRGGGVYW
jgi:heat shock protein HtpX